MFPPIGYRMSNKLASIFNHLQIIQVTFHALKKIQRILQCKEQISLPCLLPYVDALQRFQNHEFLISLEINAIRIIQKVKQGKEK